MFSLLGSQLGHESDTMTVTVVLGRHESCAEMDCRLAIIALQSLQGNGSLHMHHQEGRFTKTKI